MTSSKSQPSSWSAVVELAIDRFAGLVDHAAESLREILDAGRDIVGCSEAGLLVPGDNENELKFLVSANSRSEIAEIVKTLKVPTEGSLAGCVFNTGQMMAVANPESFYDEVDQATGLETIVYMAIPIMDTDGEVFGVATFLNRPQGQPQAPFDETEIESGMRLADLVASGLRYYQRLTMQQMLYQRELAEVADEFVENVTFPEIPGNKMMNPDEGLPLANTINNLERLSLQDLELAEELINVLVSRRFSTDQDF